GLEIRPTKRCRLPLHSAPGDCERVPIRFSVVQPQAAADTRGSRPRPAAPFQPEGGSKAPVRGVRVNNEGYHDGLDPRIVFVSGASPAQEADEPSRKVGTGTERSRHDGVAVVGPGKRVHRGPMERIVKVLGKNTGAAEEARVIEGNISASPSGDGAQIS